MMLFGGRGEEEGEKYQGMCKRKKGGIERDGKLIIQRAGFPHVIHQAVLLASQREAGKLHMEREGEKTRLVDGAHSHTSQPIGFSPSLLLALRYKYI